MSDSLGDRMKDYEVAARTRLARRVPVIVRVDGKSFHTYTRGLKRPFDVEFSNLMVSTAKELCREIQGAQLAYVQSDEISVLVHGYKRIASQSWFDNQVQKMCSVSAGIASAHLTGLSGTLWGGEIRPAVFDSRVFLVPENDVCNYFLWRQNDATRNSIQSLAQSLYSPKQLHGKQTPDLHEMCFQKGQNWNDLPIRWKRGVCVVRCGGDEVIRPSWEPDFQIPVFSRDRSYVENLLRIEDEVAT